MVLHRKMTDNSSGPKVLTTMKTRSHMQKVPRAPQAASQSAQSIGPPPGLADPWANWKDPWARAKPVVPASDDVAMAATSRMDQLEERVSNNVQQQLLRASTSEGDQKHEERFKKLEVDISELKQQHTRYEGWFQEAATVTNNMQSQTGRKSRMDFRTWKHSLPRSTARNDGARLGLGRWYTPGRQVVQPGLVPLPKSLRWGKPEDLGAPLAFSSFFVFASYNCSQYRQWICKPM